MQGIVFAAHIFMCYTIVRFFNVSLWRSRIALFAIASFLSISFIAARVLLSMSMNPLTGAFYVFSAFWAGFAVNLLPAAIICWIIAFAGWLSGYNPPLRGICAMLFTAAFLFSAYGVWNALNPVIKTVEVEIPGLPEKWQSKTVVQISDVHLGAAYSPERFSRAAKRINSLKPDVIFITGDLFDGMSSDGISSYIKPLDELQASDGVFFVNGNHENYVGIGRVLDALAKTKFRVLHDEAVQLDGVQILGVDYPDFGAHRDVKKIIRSRKEFTQGAPTILLYHTPTNIDPKNGTRAQDQTRTYWAPDTDFSVAKELGVNLQLSGHTHKGQMFPFVYLARYLYKGYEYGLHRDGDFSIYVTSGLGTFGPPIRTGTTPEIVLLKFKPLAPARR